MLHTGTRSEFTLAYERNPFRRITQYPPACFVRYAFWKQNAYLFGLLTAVRTQFLDFSQKVCILVL